MKITCGYDGLSQIRQLGRKFALIAEDIYEGLDELEDLQDSGISNIVNDFTFEELGIIGQAAEILKRKGRQLSQ